ncbi:MAG: hypothetical protein QM496_21355 [Verrucomicrobiota bacterium]
MHLSFQRLLYLLVLLSVSSNIYAAGLDEYNDKYKVAVTDARSKFEKEKTTLFDQYAKAVERLQKSFQQSGDLKNALLAKSETEKARTDRALGSVAFPGIDSLRQTMVDRLATIEKNEVASLNGLGKTLIRVLEPLRKSLTQAGALEEAMAIDQRMEGIKKSMDLSNNSLSAGKPVLSSEVVEIKDSILGHAKPVTGDHRLKVGRYKNIGRTVIGDRNNTKLSSAEKRGKIKVAAGSVFDGGEIYMDVGLLDLTDSLLRKVQFTQNLGGEFIAKGCLIDQSTFAKAGAWGNALSSRWTYDDCVISKSFFTTWRARLVGVKANRCTFESVDFEPYGYLEDAGKESVNPWWKFERCLFRDCDIPIGILLATEDCVFENCRFTRQQFPIVTRTLATLYYKGGEPKLPAEEEHYKFNLKPVEELNGKVGSSVKYEIKGGKLEFLR